MNNPPGFSSMNDDLQPVETTAREDHTLGASTLFKLCTEVILLREKNDRQHKLFESTLKSSLNTFVADTQRAFQQLRQETQGEKRFSLAVLNELLDIHMEMQHIVAQRPAGEDAEALKKWADAVEVQARKVKDAVTRHGIKEYDAVVSSAYNPALHERVGSKRVEGMGPNLVAEQRERGYASQQPEFVLRRPKVIVSE
jgi:molecular chaperone GrpE (heat shock protein)